MNRPSEPGGQSHSSPQGWPQPAEAQPWRGAGSEHPPWESAPPSVSPTQSTERIVRRPAPPTAGSPATTGTAPGGVQTAAEPGPAEGFTRRPKRGEHAFTRLARNVKQSVSSAKPSREVHELLTRVQAPVTTGRRIAVTSVRGGSGKTAVSLLAGAVFARHRNDPVLALDAAPEAGSLAWRAGVSTAGSLVDVAPALRTASGGTFASMAGVLPRTPGALLIAPGGCGPYTRLPRDVARDVARLVAVTVLDCGTGMTTATTQAVLSDAHAVVVAAPATPDGVRTTLAALAQVNTAALGRVLVVLTSTHRDSALDGGQAQAAFHRLGVPMVTIPYDRHIASGAVLDPQHVAESTALAATRVAAWSLTRARTL